MTEFTPVMPLKLMPFLSNGEYHFCQAHLFENLEESSVWSWMDHNANCLILDNGSYELGEPDVSATLRVAKRLKPFEVVCPDALRDKDKTLQLFYTHAVKLSKEAQRVMIVPHGDSVQDWADCLETMLDSDAGQFLPAITIGVPKVLDSYTGGRSAALAWIEDRLDVALGPYLGEVRYQVHLLGFWQRWDTPAHLVESFPWIRSVDTTWPYACSEQGELSTLITPKHAIADWEPEYVSKDAMKLAEVNIAICKKSIHMAHASGRNAGHG